MVKTNDGLLISTDFETLGRDVDDEHPSKKCHEIIADSIIKNIEKDLK